MPIKNVAVNATNAKRGIMPEWRDIASGEKHAVIELFTEGLLKLTVQPETEMVSRDTVPQIPKVPWSQLGPEFVTIWGRADPNDPQPEHMEIVGMNGSGKTYFLMVILQMLMLIRDPRIILVVTKQSDKVFTKLGWPIVTEYKDLKKHRQCIYWPKTKELGEKRDAFQEEKLYELLTNLWKEDANLFLAFDEIARIESLSPRVKQLVAMYWREARSMTITIIAMKQRPQGAQRDMHSETYWTITFKPKDEDDAERFAQLLGNRKIWMEVFEQMDADNHEFVIKHSRTAIAYISWIDFELTPIEPPSEANKPFH